MAVNSQAKAPRAIVVPVIADLDSIGAGDVTIATAFYSMGALNALNIEATRSEEHTSELQSLMRISYPVLRLNTKIYFIQNLTHISSFPSRLFFQTATFIRYNYHELLMHVDLHHQNR